MMHRRHSLLLASLLALLLSSCATLPGTDPTRMHFDPVEITEPNIDIVTLDNGMTLYMLPDRELPLITLSARIRTGTLYVPAKERMAAIFAGTLMKSGGVGDTGPDELDEALNFSAINMSAGITLEASYAQLNSLTRTFPEALGYFADMLRRPQFNEIRLQTKKDASLEGLRRKNDNPGNIARREFNKLLYGNDDPRGHEATEEEIKAVTRDQLVAFHQHQIRPDNIMLGITGDFDRDEMIGAIKAAFGDWSVPPVPLGDPPKLPTEDIKRVAFAHRDISQVTIRMGHLSIKRDNPDFYALNLANRILGAGSFRSRPFNEVRTKRGLAYAVGSRLSPGHVDRGIFLMGVKTRPDQMTETIRVMLDEVERLRTEPVSEEELAAAKEAYLNSFVFQSVTAKQVVHRRMVLDYLGMPKDELERVKTQTLAVTPEDILRVSQTYLRPDHITLFAVGNRKDVAPALAEFGDVFEVQLDD